MKHWQIGATIGTSFGLIITIIEFILQRVCNGDIVPGFCSSINLFNILAYFPTAYIFLPIFSNTEVFTNDNFLLTMILFIVPILQYGLIGSFAGVIYEKLKNHEVINL